MNDVERSIQSVAKTVSEVLQGKKYSIDYYQREYKWEGKQLAELVADLTAKFLELHDPGHPRDEVAKYPGYFLGSIIISRKGSEQFVVDGQQRLTSLTLLLTYLHRLQQGRPDPVDVDLLIFSKKYDRKSFNLDVADRAACMGALFERGEYQPPADAAGSVRTLVDRYGELDGLFPDELKGAALPYFVDWLCERVQLVQITANSDDDAYAIFETMNDRGLKLTPADMLRGYLLANMADGAPRTEANELWRRRLRRLDERVDDGAADFLKTWLRSQHSTKIRERRKGARPEDWDRIGTEFHRWLRAAHNTVGLRSRADFHRFVVGDLDFYSHQYERIVEASVGPFHPDSPLRFVRYNADLGFTLQYQLLLAPLRVDDDQQTVDRKLEIVGRFVDILLVRRIWNSRATAYSTLSYAMFTVMRDTRGLDVDVLGKWLRDYLLGIDETFDGNDDLVVHQQNRDRLHKLLARITDHVTVGSGQASNYLELTNGAGVKYEVEHVWADRPDRHTDEFPHAADFARHRNRIGDLLLLPKQFNASLGDLPYEDKRPHYYKQNLLAASLDPHSYEHSPGFLAFVKRTGLAFRPYDQFKKADVLERGVLYREIAKQLWNPDDLLAVAKGAI